jgi:hypothetical protein
VITIQAMARIGPWTLESLVRNPDWENCERCGQRIKEVWIVKVESVDLMNKLHGKPEWRIGSDCGPHLLNVSEKIWKDTTSDAQKRLRKVKDIDQLKRKADVRKSRGHAPNSCPPPSRPNECSTPLHERRKPRQSGGAFCMNGRLTAMSVRDSVINPCGGSAPSCGAWRRLVFGWKTWSENESFSASLRDECLNQEFFFSLEDAVAKFGCWQHHYNVERPHGSLGDVTPAEFAARHHEEAGTAVPAIV